MAERRSEQKYLEVVLYFLLLETESRKSIYRLQSRFPTGLRNRRVMGREWETSDVRQVSIIYSYVPVYARDVRVSRHFS